MKAKAPAVAADPEVIPPCPYKERRHRKPKSGAFNRPEIRAEILRLLKEGCTTSEICHLPGYPSRAVLFDWLQADPAFRAEYEAAKVAAAEAVLDEALDRGRDAGVPVDAHGKQDLGRMKVAQAFANIATAYAAAIAPRQYGQLVKVGAEAGAGGITIQVVQYEQPRTGRATEKASEIKALERDTDTQKEAQSGANGDPTTPS